MDLGVDQYAVIGLPTAEEEAELSEREIKDAYQSKANELHPERGQMTQMLVIIFRGSRLLMSFLRMERLEWFSIICFRLNAISLCVNRYKNTECRQMMSDLEEREQAAFASDSRGKSSVHAKKAATPAALTVNEGTPKAKESSTSSSQGGGLVRKRYLRYLGIESVVRIIVLND